MQENQVIEIIPYLKIINDKVKMKIDHLLHEANITLSQSMCILLLLTMNGALKQKELQSLLKISHSAMVRMIQRLEEKKLVYVNVDAEDKRGKIVGLTESGIKLANEIKNAAGYLNNPLEKIMTAVEINNFKEYLKRIVEHIEILD